MACGSKMLIFLKILYFLAIIVNKACLSRLETVKNSTYDHTFCKQFFKRVKIRKGIEKCTNQTLNYFNQNMPSMFQPNTSILYQFNLKTNQNEMISNRSKRNVPQSRLKTDSNIRIFGFRVEHASTTPDVDDQGIPYVLANTEFTLRLFGENLNENVSIIFTQHRNKYGTPCLHLSTNSFSAGRSTVSNYSILVNVKIQKASKDPYFLCAKYGIENDDFQEMKLIDNVNQKKSVTIEPFFHQGDNNWLCLYTYNKMLPLWLSITISVICLCLSSLLSGLNLGLMSLDKTDLKILCNTGSDKERHYATLIRPVRETGNYLLCSILLGNVLVNSIFTIILDDLTSGLIAVIFSTLAIVIVGEIAPQAICSRHGLVVGAKTIYVTRTLMFLTSPLSYPISKILDYILKEEIGIVYTRERLKELIKMSTANNDLDKDEVNIISGALELRKKCVKDVMTHIEDVFMLNIESVLDFETVSEIMKSGFSRIPIYENDRQNLVSILYIKDLAFVDPDDNVPLRSHCQFYQNHCYFVFEDSKLDVMFKQFKEGNKGHMAFVHHIKTERDSDPFYEVVGLVTLEDVIEELIQAEIMDETDVFTDNRSKRRRQAHKLRQDFSMFAEKHHRSFISPQLALATFQFLSTSVDPFKSDYISNTILHRLLRQDIIFHVKKPKDKTDEFVIYEQGKVSDYFILILEGRVEVRVGKENLVFESGPFTYFGTQALTQNIGSFDSPLPSLNIGSVQSLNIESAIKSAFIPDYTVRATSEVIYIQINRAMYLQAKRATLMERTHSKGSAPVDPFDTELFNCFDNDDFDQKTPQSTKSHSEKESKKEDTQMSLNDVSLGHVDSTKINAFYDSQSRESSEEREEQQRLLSIDRSTIS